MKIARNRGVFGPLVLGVTLMAALYGLIVYAGEIDLEVDTVVNSIPGGTLDATYGLTQKMMKSSVTGMLNDRIKSELFVNPSMTPEDAMILSHFGKYCAEGTETGDCTADPLLMFGDIKVSSILSSSIYDSEMLAAAQGFLNSITMPASGPFVKSFSNLSSIDANTITADPGLKSSFVQALTTEAVLSVAREPFAEMISKRQNINGNSEMQLMEREAAKRFMSAIWRANNAASTRKDIELLADQNEMQAFQNWMEYQRYRQTERLEALLAVLVMQNHKNSQSASSNMDKADASQKQLDDKNKSAPAAGG